MALAFPCPSCGGSRKVRDDLAGKRIRCPDCAAVIAVPASTEIPAPTATPIANTAITADMLIEPEPELRQQPAAPEPPATGSRLVRVLTFVASAFGFLIVAAMILSGIYPDLFRRGGPADDTPVRIALKNKRFAESDSIKSTDRLSKPRNLLGKVREMPLRKGTCYLISVRSDSLDPRLIVLDSTDRVVTEKGVEGIPHQAYEYFLPEEDGDHRVVVTTDSGARVGDYVLDISISEARSLPTEVIKGDIGPTDQIDVPRTALGRVHRMRLEKGKEYTFKTEGKGFKSITYLLDADTKVVLRETSPLLPDGLVFFRPIEEGEYEIIVTSTNGKETGSYTVSMREWDVEAPPAKIVKTTQEPPLGEVAKPIPGKLDDGRFEHRGQIDAGEQVADLPGVVGKTFEFELLAGRGYRIDLECPLRFGNIIVLTANGKHLVTSRNPGENALSVLEFSPKLTQKYRIVVESTEGPFILRLLEQSRAASGKKASRAP